MLAHLFALFSTGGGIGTDICKMDTGFLADDIYFGSDNEHESCCLIYPLSHYSLFYLNFISNDYLSITSRCELRLLVQKWTLCLYKNCFCGPLVYLDCVLPPPPVDIQLHPRLAGYRLFKVGLMHCGYNKLTCLQLNTSQECVCPRTSFEKTGLNSSLGNSFV